MAAYISIADGTWVTDATWSGSGTPGSDDDVIVQGHTVTVDAPAEARSVIVNGGLISLANQPLTVTANCEIRSAGAISRVATGTLIIGGDCKMRDGSALLPAACTIAGDFIALGGILGTSAASMTLAVSGLARLLACQVARVDASGGNRIVAYGCKNLGGNTNIDFYLARGRRAVLMLSRRAFQTGLAA